MYDSSQEIMVYKASLPYMQAAKDLANSLQMNDHGPMHAQRVHWRSKQLGKLTGLSSYEISLLLASALLHDIGMVKNREEHHKVSRELVVELSQKKVLPFNEEEADIVGTLCEWHRKEYDPDKINKELEVRVGLLAQLLRIADGMDVDCRRSDSYCDAKDDIVKQFYGSQRRHHLSVISILALRIHTNYIGTKIEIILNDFGQAQLQIERLVAEMLGTRILWPVQVVPVSDRQGYVSPVLIGVKRKALVVAYCNAHGLISAAISKRQLELLNFDVDIVCDFESTGSPRAYWEKCFSQFDFSGYNYVALLDLYIPDECLRIVVEIINRNAHCNWNFSSPLDMSTKEVAELISSGVNILLSDERTGFVGSSLDNDSIFWCNVSGLCNFDDCSTLSRADRAEYDVSRGLRYALQNAIAENKEKEHYKQIVERIESCDKEFFFAYARELSGSIISNPLSCSTYGRVLL